MSLQRAFVIAAQGLTAQRTRMETISSNMANMRSTRSPEGGPYRRLAPLFVSAPVASPFADGPERMLRTVRVERIVADGREPVRRYEPDHPDADAEGYVAYPNVDPVEEMVDMLSATRSYEANVTLVKSVRDMLHAALDILG